MGGGLGLILLVQTFFVFYAVMRAPNHAADQTKTVGKTLDLGSAMYTQYLLPVEIVGVLTDSGDNQGRDPCYED